MNPHAGGAGRCRVNDQTHPGGILTRISLKYLGLQTEGRGIFASVEFNVDGNIQRLTDHGASVYPAQIHRLRVEHGAK